MVKFAGVAKSRGGDTNAVNLVVARPFVGGIIVLVLTTLLYYYACRALGGIDWRPWRGDGGRMEACAEWMCSAMQRRAGCYRSVMGER